jgi:hypothetical protein
MVILVRPTVSRLPLVGLPLAIFFGTGFGVGRFVKRQ